MYSWNSVSTTCYFLASVKPGISSEKVNCAYFFLFIYLFYFILFYYYFFFCKKKSCFVLLFQIIKPGFIAQSIARLVAAPGLELESQLDHITLVEVDYEIIFTVVFLSFLLIQ